MRRSLPWTHRRPTRHAVRLPCQIVRERDFRLIADRLENLSLNGALVTPADPMMTGERVIVSFQAPRWGLWVDTEATVTRVLHGRRPGEHTRALGLEFDDLDKWTKFVLERNLSWIPSAPPSARPGRRLSKDAMRVLARLSGHVMSV